MIESTASALDRLAAITSDLDAYIERRAAELAAPLVQAAEEAAQAKVAEAQHARQRAEDLVAELRRQLRAALKQLDKLSGQPGGDT